jgi:hypothetical protein
LYGSQAQQQDDTYARQLQKVNEQLAVVEAQQKRMDSVRTQYEDHAKRYEAVLQHWERQANTRK